ncbi:hypothetical protein AB0C38_14750 [Amycolatopsis sp. NPDC048633]|uniref:hypothetical protein n=1 Tax=Amycolatopsis sp. NPDC048633 TaxID=3157095 RepID=UPI0033D3D576
MDGRLRFTVTVFVEARWGGAAPAPPALLDIALHGVARRADDVARRHPLTAQERLRYGLNADLHRWEQVPETGVMARGHCVSIDTDAELVAAVAAREEAARHQLVGSWVEEQRARRTERMSTLLLDPLRATAAWFLENQDKPEQVVETATEFKKLQEVLAPEQGPDSAGVLLDELLTTIDEPGRLRALTVLKRLLAERDRHDLAARVVFPDGDAAQY